MLMSPFLLKGADVLCLSLQHMHPRIGDVYVDVDVNVGVDVNVDVEELPRLTRIKLRLLASTRAVLQLVTVGAVLRETARLPQAATVMSPATTSGPAVVTSQMLAATVRISGS